MWYTETGHLHRYLPSQSIHATRMVRSLPDSNSGVGNVSARTWLSCDSTVCENCEPAGYRTLRLPVCTPE
ncbi:hypothetical protein E2C01_024576 [Portunus trituberculatus]|uniref:Uncharacterized protein n=1 Tax=Portunus trituberculatus TaxID=210409 RepID=A0A5B7EB04_PORTR|nr:hypothetical protein [Portunus trituberculatus]